MDAAGWDSVLADIDRLIMPGITLAVADFFAYFPANVSGPAVLGELLAPAWACKECCGRPARRARNWR